MRIIELFKENKGLLILPVVLLIIFVSIAGIKGSKNSRVGTDSISPSSGAVLFYNKKSYSVTNENASETLLLADLAFFARKNFQAYTPASQPLVSFSITNNPVSKGDTISFEGRYQEVKDRITVSVTTLKNRRIKTSILDTKTSTNIDSLLPSNDKVNQFILSLPLSTPNYRIYYSLQTNRVTVNLNMYSPTDKQAAISQIRAATGSEYITSDNINIFYALSPPGITDHVDYIRDTLQ
jgi:hypothetical protein